MASDGSFVAGTHEGDNWTIKLSAGPATPNSAAGKLWINECNAPNPNATPTATYSPMAYTLVLQ